MKQYIQQYQNIKGSKKQISAGILLYRLNNGQIEVLLGKNGGPLWEKRYHGAWNIPKGHLQEGQSIKQGAIRQFQQETSIQLQIDDILSMMYLGTSTTSSGKQVHIFAIAKDCADQNGKVTIQSNMVQTQWPLKSGNKIMVPQLSEGRYFKLPQGNKAIFPYQRVFLQRLQQLI